MLLRISIWHSLIARALNAFSSSLPAVAEAKRQQFRSSYQPDGNIDAKDPKDIVVQWTKHSCLCWFDCLWSHLCAWIALRTFNIEGIEKTGDYLDETLHSAGSENITENTARYTRFPKHLSGWWSRLDVFVCDHHLGSLHHVLWASLCGQVSLQEKLRFGRVYNVVVKIKEV